MQSRREAATGRTMTASVNLYSDTRRTPQNATGAVKQGETKKGSASNATGGYRRPIFCYWCGVKRHRERRKKNAIKMPKPRKLRSGAWNIKLRAGGQSRTEATAEQCEAKARTIRAGFIEAKKAAPKMTIYAALEENSSVRKENSSVRKSVRKSAIIFPMLYALYPLPPRCRGGLFLSPRTALLRSGAPCRGKLPFPSRSLSRRRMW